MSSLRRAAVWCRSASFAALLLAALPGQQAGSSDAPAAATPSPAAAPVAVPAGAPAAQSADIGPPRASAPVGVHGHLGDVVLPPDLEVRPIERGAPLLLRIVAVWPHGSERRYDLEFQGFEPGRYDLAANLQRIDGSAVSLPAIPVEITSALPPGQVEPTPIAPDRPPRLGGYVLLLWLVGLAWVAGLGLILFGFRRRRAATAVVDAPRPRSLAERLRPMVDAAMAGRLDDADKAELERLLVSHWDRRAGVTELPMRDALARLRDHPEAGPLLRQLEEWLHRPGPPRQVDLEVLLGPYRDVPDPGAADPGAREVQR